MIPYILITYIEATIIPRYKEFDKAHNLSHVCTGIEESLAARQYSEADERLAYVVAAYHDTGLCHPPPCLRLDADGRLHPAASFQPNIRRGKVIAVSMKHMPHFIFDYEAVSK